MAKARALFTLKNVLRALRGKRFVVEAPAAAAGLSQVGVETFFPVKVTNEGVPIPMPNCSLHSSMSVQEPTLQTKALLDTVCALATAWRLPLQLTLMTKNACLVMQT